MRHQDPAMDWLEKNLDASTRDLARLVAIPGISTDGNHLAELEKSAQLVADLAHEAGFPEVEVLRPESGYPAVLASWKVDPSLSTVLMLSHHDVQPCNYLSQWDSDPWVLTEKNGRLYGRGSADDKGGVIAQIMAVKAWAKSRGKPPVNVSLLVEGEEEVGSKNLLSIARSNQYRLHADALVVCDTENIQAGLPSITCSLRGVVTLKVTAKSATIPSHSGMAGGALADPAIALCWLLGKLAWNKGPIPVNGLYEGVKPVTENERRIYRSLPGDESGVRRDLQVLPGVSLAIETGKNFHEQTWRRPSVTVIALEASSIGQASNQVLPKAEAIISCRIVPDQDPDKVAQVLSEFLRQPLPWGVEVSVEEIGSHVKWWKTDPSGPAFQAAMEALESGYGVSPVATGCGGTIGFIEPLEKLLGGAPALLFGIEDPISNAHAPNESLHKSDWQKLMKSLAGFLGKMAAVEPGKCRTNGSGT